MNLTISPAVAREYGLHGATVLAYLQYCYDHDHDNEGRFTAPKLDLQFAFKVTEPSFNRARNQLEEGGLITTQRLPNSTLYTLNHDAIRELTSRGVR